MNKILRIVLVSTIALASCLPLRAQTDTNVPPPSTTGPSAGLLSDIWNGVSKSGVLKSTNYSADPYATYAPSAPKGHQYGAGLFVAYNVNDYVGLGIGVDYLGQFSLVSANVQLKYETHPFSGFGGPLANVAVTPFGLVGAGHPLGGTSSSVTAISDVGGYVSFGHVWNGRFNVGAAYGRWDGAGVYSGTRYHFFLGWAKGI